MTTPLVPCRESGRWLVDRFGALELTPGRDVDSGSPLGQFLVGDGPRGVWRFGLALIEPSPLLGRGRLEVVHLEHRAPVGRGMSQSGALVSTPEAEVDDDAAAQFED